MAGYTVIVADHSAAGIYRLPATNAPLRRIAVVANPAGHRHERDLGSDAPGRVMGWAGVRHAFTARHTLQQHATEMFVRAIVSAARPVAGRRPGTEVLVVAAPGLRGTLRRFMPPLPAKELRTRVVRFISGPPERPRRVWFGAA
jgi:hypothetical protein